MVVSQVPLCLLSPPVSDAKSFKLSYGTKQTVKERLPDFFFLFRKTSMISRVFISFSAVQIDDLSYIHLIFFIIYGFITNSQSDQLTKWLDSSVDRTLHRYRTGHGFKSRSGLKLLSGVHNCLSCVQNCDDQSCLYISELFYHNHVNPRLLF